MKHVRTFEKLNNIPELGDYIITSYENNYNDECLIVLSDYLNNTIGIVHNIRQFQIDVKYDNVPHKLKHLFNGEYQNIRTYIPFDNIVCYGKTKEEVEIKFNSLNYNL